MSHNAKEGPGYVCDVRLLIQLGTPNNEPTQAEVCDYVSETFRDLRGVSDWSYVHYERTAPTLTHVPDDYAEGDLHGMALEAGLEDTSNDDVEYRVYVHLERDPKWTAIGYVHAKNEVEAAGIVALAWKYGDWDVDAWSREEDDAGYEMLPTDRVVIDSVERDMPVKPKEVHVEMLEQLKDVARGLRALDLNGGLLKDVERVIGKATAAGIGGEK